MSRVTHLKILSCHMWHTWKSFFYHVTHCKVMLSVMWYVLELSWNVNSNMCVSFLLSCFLGVLHVLVVLENRSIGLVGCDGWSLVLVEIVLVFSSVGLEAGEMQPTDFFTGDRVFVFFVPNVMKVKLFDNCPKTSWLIVLEVLYFPPSCVHFLISPNFPLHLGNVAWDIH